MDEDACEMHSFGLERMVRRKMGATIVIGVVIFAYAGFIVYKKVKDRKRGNCGCGCSSCSRKCGK